MSSAFYPKASIVMERAIEVQELCIPFLITHSATPSTKVLGTDEASVLFLKTQGLSQISTTSGALDPGEASPTFDLSAADSSGAFNLLVNLAPGGNPGGDTCVKLMCAVIFDRINGTYYPTYVNSSNSATDANNHSWLLNCASGVNLSTTDLNGCLIVKYTVSE